MKYIVLVSGKKRAGKDFISKLLAESLLEKGYNCEVIAFADPIKEILCRTLNVDLETFNEYKNNEEPIFVKEDGEYKVLTNFRSIIQNFGTDAMKAKFGDDVWVKLTNETIAKSEAEIIIVSDFRFKIEHISNNTIRVNNDDLPDDSHKSENDLIDFNFNFKINIDNTGKPDQTLTISGLANNIINDYHNSLNRRSKR